MSIVGRFLALSPRDRLLAVEALLCLALARLMLLAPFRWLAPILGAPKPFRQPPPDSAEAADAADRTAAHAVRCALLRVETRLPWRSTCLAGAIAGHIMLRRRGIATVLHLGVRGTAATGLSAHAWLRCKGMNVVGTEAAAPFMPIAVFHE